VQTVLNIVKPNLYYCMYLCIQSDSGGKANILGNDIVDHCEGKVRMNISVMRMATKIELFESVDTKAL
jgi:hypothetical protein